MGENNSQRDNNLPAGRKKSQAWELFWQEHGEELMNEESLQKSEANINKREFNKNGEKPLREPFLEEKSFKKPANPLPAAKEKIIPGEYFAPGGKAENGRPLKEGDKKGKSLSQRGKTIIIILAGLIVLAGAVFGSAYFLQQKLMAEKAAISANIDEKIAQLGEANQLALEDINQRMAAIDSQMAEIITILESTDKAILSSGAANREAMAKRIEELDKQLASLKKSLNILMESKGAQ